MSSFYVECIGAEKFQNAEQMLADVPGGMERALKSATKRAVSFLRTQSTKEIRQRYDISRKNIRAEQNIRVNYRYFNGVEARVSFRGNKIHSGAMAARLQRRRPSIPIRPSWPLSTAIFARFIRALPRQAISSFQLRRPRSPARSLHR